LRRDALKRGRFARAPLDGRAARAWTLPTKKRAPMNVRSTQATTQPPRRALGALVLLCGGVAAIVTSYSLHAGMRYNALRLPFEERLSMPLFLPQGWKYFTRDAREERTHPFTLSADGSWVNAGAGTNGDRGHLLGARRDSRAQTAEVTALMHQAEGTHWT